MSARDALRVYAEALPPGTVLPVPRELLLELLAGAPAQVPTEAPARDLTVADLAGHFGRSPGTIRAWLEAGRFEGAYKLRGKSWRVPVGALAGFVEAQRRQADPSQATVGRVVPLDAWRRSA
jgi:hypothetical protein